VVFFFAQWMQYYSIVVSTWSERLRLMEQAVKSGRCSYGRRSLKVIAKIWKP
jgi:hypothetical protein